MNRPTIPLMLFLIGMASLVAAISNAQAGMQEQVPACTVLAEASMLLTPTLKPTTKPPPKPTAKPTPKTTPKPTPAPKTYAQSDLDLLARVVYAEAGSDWCSDEMQLLVANVVINRMHDSRFPNTLRGVIYQRGQYQSAHTLGHVKPNARAIRNAKRVLSGERFCPAKVVWQSESRQGKGVWKKVGNQYFCY